MEQENGTNGRLSDRLDALIDEVTASAPDEGADVSPLENAPFGAAPSGAPPSGAVPSGAVPSDTVPTGTTSTPDLSALLGGLVANPDLMAKLPQMLGTLGPLLGSLGGGHSPGSIVAGKPHADRHTALLCAVKPYLCAQRQAAADQLLQLCKMWDLLQKASPSHASQGGDAHV